LDSRSVEVTFAMTLAANAWLLARNASNDATGSLMN
jgi:hypothetical protein